jgi:hypothetical protein
LPLLKSHRDLLIITMVASVIPSYNSISAYKVLLVRIGGTPKLGHKTAILLHLGHIFLCGLDKFGLNHGQPHHRLQFILHRQLVRHNVHTIGKNYQLQYI